MNKKGIYFILLFLPTTIVPNKGASISQHEIDLELEGLFDDDSEVDTLFNEPTKKVTAEIVLGYITKPRADAATRATCPTDPLTILDAQKILREDLYLFTHPFNQRSILDMPQFYFSGYRDCLRAEGQPWQFTCQLFYNQMNSSFFTNTDHHLNSYLALNNPNFIPNIDDLGFNINLMRVFEIVGGARVTQYRAGLMLQAQYLKNNWLIQWWTPIEYLLRHFDLTPLEQEDLTQELHQERSLDTEWEFAERHLIADRVGLGDFRLDVAYRFVHDDHIDFHAGIETTLPFACAIKKGLLGNHFRKNAPTPNLDLIYLLNTALNDLTQAQQIGTDFLLAALDRLSRILLEDGLGNNGHVGFGPFFQCNLHVAEKLQFKTRAVVEYLFQAQERRYYIMKKDIAAFDAILNPGIADCDAELTFLEQQLVNTLFPQGFDTVVYPGFLTKITTALTGDMAERWRLTLGYDFWFQQREKLGNIDAPKNEKELLKKQLARCTSAFQNKIFGGISYVRPCYDTVDWALTIWGDMTFMSMGIGRDFNLGISFELLL